MFIQKTKSYTNLIPLSEIKEHLRIDQNDNAYNNELTRLTKTAVSIAEKYIQSDLSITTNTLEDYCVHSCSYDIYESNIQIQSISGTTTSGDNITLTGYSVQKYSSYTRIKFNTSISFEILNITYNSGYSTIPFDISQAIKIKVSELFDIDRQNYTSNTVKYSKAFERLLAPYVNYNF